MSKVSELVEIRLEYLAGRDEPARGIFRNQVVEPEFKNDLLIAVRGFPGTGSEDVQPQVHLVGTAAGLEELGKYLIALARLETADPEPYGSFDEISNADGGVVRLLPRRLQTLPGQWG